jgi:hypothetical protein
MKIPREKVLDVLRSRGQSAQIDEAAAELPRSVDTTKDHDLLVKYNVTAKDLVRL